MTSETPPPLTYDPELRTFLTEGRLDDTSHLSLGQIPALRAQAPEAVAISTIKDLGFRTREFLVPAFQDGIVAVSVIDRDRGETRSPCVYYIHGGGMVFGNRWDGLESVLPWIDRHQMTIVTVEYRLAPEFPAPYPVEDCYAGLTWIEKNAQDLGIDLGRLVIAGTSAGGGIAAGTALLARDRKGPALLAQALFCPMLDDRDGTVSTVQFSGTGGWDRESNRVGWSALLGDDRCSERVSIYSAPARSASLVGLPPAFIDCGSTEVFRDEDVDYASALWRDGVQAELHVWPGGFHCFDTAAPTADLSTSAITARDNWIARILRNA